MKTVSLFLIVVGLVLQPALFAAQQCSSGSSPCTMACCKNHPEKCCCHHPKATPGHASSQEKVPACSPVCSATGSEASIAALGNGAHYATSIIAAATICIPWDQPSRNPAALILSAASPPGVSPVPYPPLRI